MKQVRDETFTFKLKPEISPTKSRPPCVEAASFFPEIKLKKQHLPCVGDYTGRLFLLPGMWPRRSSWRFETAPRLTTLGVPRATWRLHSCGSETR